ncbi:MAG: nicotinate (nicotinamide) nucleotide adenylyltransferase [Oscillospiraceae bacterium]|jgi:nicotinate-nucleotide adenylyltransferase|nr:nicotinate (nicotinamide) nucleotide adenylyltransferase [Oscillospiraceae bacterium]
MAGIVLYGGSFDPPHKGHVAAARTALRELKPRALLWIPSLRPPHKPGRALAAPAHRAAMCRLAVNGLPGAEVCEVELTEPLSGYTVDTVRLLRQRYPGEGLYLLMGFDMLLSLDTWRSPDELRSLCTVTALRREEGAASRPPPGGALILPHRPYEISGTLLRGLLAAGKGREHLPDGVWEYITGHGLYAA